MSTYFERNPQRLAQWNRRRRNGNTDSGVVVVHTYEAPAGRTAAAGAKYLTERTNHGSYHWLADALGDTLHLAPWSAETWHETTVNNHAVGVSMMAYAADWKKLTPTQRRNLIRGAALGAHLYSRWRVANGKSAVPARRITRAQAIAKVPGFIGHGDIDTARRTDPGRDFPWDEFLTEYARLEGGQTTTTPVTVQEDDMIERLFISTDAAGNRHHYGTLGPAHYTYVSSEGDYIKGRESLGRDVKWWENTANDRTVSNPTIFGVYVGPDTHRPKNA